MTDVSLNPYRPLKPLLAQLCGEGRVGEILWAADRYGWSDSFDPSTLSSEEWRGIHRAYFEHLCEEEDDDEEEEDEEEEP